ncbi:MAG: hypothetical protein ACLR6B_03275 [Blautia sp.]
MENGLAITVVNMYKEEHQSVKDIVFWFSIKEKDVYDIFETKEAVR